MDAEEFFKGLPQQDKLAVITVALPGIKEFLGEVLVEENLSDKGEQFRLDFVDILDKLGWTAQGNEIYTPLTNDHQPPHQSGETHRRKTEDDLQGDIEDNTAQTHWSAEAVVIGDKEVGDNLPCHKETASTGDGGIIICSSPLPQADSPVHLDSLNLPMLDSVDTWSRETIISEASSAELEIYDGSGSDVNVQEEGYFTGDNVFVDYSVQKLDLEPNELGELHSGVMYIREHPGWHKRWFTMNNHCLTCFRHRSESRMLFQIPLKGAKIVPTDQKKSRMFPLTLSVPRIHETITFATTEEHTRQKWVYVMNCVISRLKEDEETSDVPVSPSFNSYDSYCKLVGSESDPDKHNISAEVSEKNELLRRRKVSCWVESPRIVEPSQSWTSSKNSAHSNEDETLTQWKLGLDDEDEMLVMNNDLSPDLGEDESFKELQEILPDIIQGLSGPTSGGKKKNKILKANSLVKVNEVSEEGALPSGGEKSLSTSDLQTAGPKVKRHSSLVTSLSSKAMRVKSRLTGSIFSKGRKHDPGKGLRDISSTKSTTFSGYLLRKKGPNWKNRWCVVKEHWLFCYKDFGVGIAELEVPLLDTSIKTVEDKDYEKPYMFILTCEKEDLYFAAENEAELEEWLLVLKDEIEVTDNSTSVSVFVADSSEQTQLSAPAIFSLVSASAPSSPSTSQSKSRRSNKGNKDVSPATEGKKTSIFSSLGNKLTKTKPKAFSSGAVNVPSEAASESHSVEDGLVSVQPASRAEHDQDESTGVGKHTQIEGLEVPFSHSMEGFLNQRVEEDTWLKCWVRLEKHSLHIHDEKDSADSVVVKIKLNNCVVKDWIDAKRPFVMEIRRTLGRPHYLQAESESEYLKWKESISSAVIHSPKVTRRPVLTWSSTEEGPATSQRHKSKYDSVERDEVFQKIEETATSNPGRPNTPLNPSPRPSTAGDVSNSESDDGQSVHTLAQSEPVLEPVERWRSFSEGEQEEERKTRTKLHRSISNAIQVLPHLPGKRKRRSRTVPNICVSPDLLVNVKHSSCLFMRSGKGLWTKRWCVLQQDKLHLFKRPDEEVPVLSIPLSQCEVRRTNKKTKKFTFELNVPSEKEDYCFAADNEKEMLTWIRMLRVIAEEEPPESRLLNGHNKVSNAEALHESKDPTQDTNQFSPEVRKIDQNGNGDEPSSSPTGLLKDQNLITAGGKREDLSMPNTVSKPTSLDGVLKLLQDQQLLQQIGQQKFNRVKRAQEAWQRSAAAVLKEKRKGSETSDPGKGDTTVVKGNTGEPIRRRAVSMSTAQTMRKELELIPITSFQDTNDAIEKFEKLAEEEKLRTLKKETLLKKRRNSLTLEKGVLQKKIHKQSDKKNTVKKLLGKDEVASVENKQHAEERLLLLNQELANIEKDLMDNKMNEAQALDNLNVMKTKTVRKLSFVKPATTKVQLQQKRDTFKNSHSESSSSQGSTEDRSGRDSPKTPQSLEAARKQSTAVSLAVLENELRKISPVGGRKLTLAGININNNIIRDPMHGRVSQSSEGSQEDCKLKDSPVINRKLELEKEASSESDGSATGDMSSFPKKKLCDTAEVRRKKYSTGSQVAFHKLSVEIPTQGDSKDEEHKHRPSVTSQRSIDETIALRKVSVASDSDGHRASLMNALSQIKDFEEFAAVSIGERRGK